jgi:xanthine dehydrogenase accessory factor
MHTKLLQMAADLAAREEPFVLALVVNRRPASSSQPGDMALITAAGAFHGWLGGSCTQPTVVREAQRALRDGIPRLLALSPEVPGAEWGTGEHAGAGTSGAQTASSEESGAAGATRAAEAARQAGVAQAASAAGTPASPGARPDGGGPRAGVTFFPMTCQSGGSVEIYLEPIVPAVRLVVFGVSPTARALAKLGKAMDYVLLAADAAAEPAMFPGADRIFVSGDDPELAAAAARGPCFAVVATMGEGDEEAIRAALGLRPVYLGVVASSRRFAQMRETLLAQGVEAAALAPIRSPAGKDIGAQTPAEIALSVLAEIVELRRRLAQPPATESAAGADLREAAREAVDPVCGMSVAVAGARHLASHEGLTYYFCCSGCRARFAADPRRFLDPRPAVASPAGRSGGSAS